MREAGDPTGRMAANLVHFARALRGAGIRAGPAQLATAAEALQLAGVERREDVFATLQSSLVSRQADLEVFAQVFDMFWRDPDFLGRMLHLTSPKLPGQSETPEKSAAHRRASEALQQSPMTDLAKPREEVVLEAMATASGTEVLGAMDFEQMSAADLRAAEAAIRSLRLPVPAMPARRFQPRPQGPVADPRATLRAAMRRGGEMTTIIAKSPRRRPPDLVAICDISGSMSLYSRMILLYLHALSHARERSWGRVSAFTFGTRLSNVTRAMDRPDPDVALSLIGAEVADWQGGTRIADALDRFNKDWSRRVLGQGAAVILITDGLERGSAEALSAAAARLGRTARPFIWLNPLLRFDQFAPEARGIKALLPHVHALHACHSLDSLADLSSAFATPDLRDHFLSKMKA